MGRDWDEEAMGIEDEIALSVGNRKWIRERIAQALQAAYREGLDDAARVCNDEELRCGTLASSSPRHTVERSLHEAAAHTSRRNSKAIRSLLSDSHKEPTK